MSVQPDEGDIVYFFYDEADKNKFAINLEPLVLHKHKDTFNGVIVTSQNVENLYPGDHLLRDGTLYKPSKVICDQVYALPKKKIEKIVTSVTKNDLKGIRRKAIESIGYKETTLN
jgi:mRNA-degrading endonuclease toxin of MazEF toxin-antitoxin module